MEKGDELNSYVFNLFVYDLDNGVFEFFTGWKFFGIDVKEAVSNAEQWIEKSFFHPSPPPPPLFFMIYQY